MGQLAVSYVLTHYGAHRDRAYLDGFSEAQSPKIFPAQLWELMNIAAGLTVNEEAKRQRTTPAMISTEHCRVFRALNVPGKPLAAVRLGMEHRLLSAARPQGPAPSLELHPYDLVAFDLYTRGLTGKEIGQFMGGSMNMTSRSRLPRILRTLGVSEERKALAVGKMYELDVFTVGLALLPNLADHSSVVEKCDQLLGREQPFNEPDAKKAE